MKMAATRAKSRPKFSSLLRLWKTSPAHRTAALRAVLASSALSLASEKGGCALEPHAKGIETSIAQTRLSEIHSQWLKRIPDEPEEPEELWDWLLEQEQSVVMELLAFCVGQTDLVA
jgi:hypothetical protein